MGAPPLLDTAAQRVLQELRQRDREVRLHEQAHLAAAGAYARGGPRYTYQTGPDGRRYAVSGEVPIDVSTVPGDPQATLRKALTIRRAALAPAQPSAADQAVAAKAAALAAQAQQALLQAQSARHLATPDATAPRTETGTATTRPETPPTVTGTRHLCGPHCQNHGVAPPPGGHVPVSATPLTVLTRALQSYQAAAGSVAA